MRPTHALPMVLLLLAPAVLAQVPGAQDAARTNTEVQATPFQDAIPNGTSDTTTAEVTYTWQPQGRSMEPTTVEVTVNDTPPWLDASVDPSSFQVDVSGPPGTDSTRSETRTVNVTVVVPKDAPDGFHAVTVVAHARENGMLLAGSWGDAPLDVTVEPTPANGSLNGTSGSAGTEADGAASNPVPAPVGLAPLAVAAVLAARRSRRPR